MRARVGLLALVLLPGACFVSIDESLLDRTDAAADGPPGDAPFVPGKDGEAPADGREANDGALPCIVDLAAGRFCDDFDHDPLGNRWTGRQINGGLLTLSNDAPPSAPNALHVDLPVKDSGANERIAVLYEAFTEANRKVNYVACSMRIAIDSLDPNVLSPFLMLQRGGKVFEQFIRVEGTQSANQVTYDVNFDGSTSSSPYAFTKMAPGWRTLSFEASETSFVLIVDGNPLVSVPMVKMYPSIVMVLIGSSSSAPSRITVRYDDFRCTFNFGN
jgi:hypothetical protein